MAGKTILQWLSRNWLGLIAGITLLVIALSVSYYFVLFLPKEHILRLDLEHQEKLKEEERTTTEQRWKFYNSRILDGCLSTAEEDYKARWEQTYLSLNLGKNCLLPKETSDSYSRDLKDAREECYRRNPQR
jgi:hypothetical protein